MQQLTYCDHCQFHAHSPYLLCAVYPMGIKNESCIDFRLSSDFEVNDEDWCPDGYMFVLGLLVKRSLQQANPILEAFQLTKE